MKKLFSFLTLICFGFTFAQTIVNVDITNNTTWTVAGSPYIIDAPLINIDSAATLTIEPGVEVTFNDRNYDLRVLGRLIAIGTPTDSIGITGTQGRNDILFMGEVQFEYVHIENMFYGLLSIDPTTIPSAPASLPGGPIASVRHASFINNPQGITFKQPTGGSPMQVDSCYFEGGNTAIYGDGFEVNDCVFKDQIIFGIARGYYPGSTQFISINRCTFSGQQANNYVGAITSHLPIEIRDCQFYDNHTAINLYLSLVNGNTRPSIIENNILKDNHIGMRLQRDTGLVTSQNLRIHQNQLCNDSTNLHYWYRPGPAPTVKPAFPLLDLRNNCWCQWDSLGADSTISNGDTLPLNFMPIDSSCLPSLVFPGDANHDQVANNFDLLPIGVWFNSIGFPRPNANNNWVGQRSRDWSSLQANGRNIKHVDCNGDSLINWDDTLAINLNYGLTHNSWRSAAAGGSTKIRFSMPTTNINPGDTISIPIELGTFDTLAMGVYGIAFSINYDKMMIDSASVRVDYSNSWLGTKNSDMLTIDKDFYPFGQVDIGLARNDQQNRTGYGTIADLIVVISDDLTKRELPFVLEFSNIRAIDSVGQEIAVQAESGEAIIETDPTLALDQDFAPDLKVYPNPIKDQLMLAHDKFIFNTVTLVSITGQKVPLWEGRQRQRIALSIPSLSPGIYLLVIDMEEGRKTVKVELR